MAVHFALLAAPSASTGATILAVTPSRESERFELAAADSAQPELLRPCDDAAFGRTLAAADDAALARPTSCRVRGIVRSGDTPVAGVAVQARQFCGRGPLAAQTRLSIVTDEHGRFDAEFAPDATLVLSAQDVHSASQTRVLKLGHAPVNDVELDMLPQLAVRRRVVFEGRRSVPETEVQKAIPEMAELFSPTAARFRVH